MMIDVHLADGRTVFRLLSRGQMIDLIKRETETLDESRAIRCWARWHPQDEFVAVRLLNVRRHSIAFTRQVEPAERDEFLAGRADDELPTHMRATPVGS